MYDEGYSVDKAAEMVRRIAEESRVPDTGFAEQFLDYEGYIKERLRVRLLNKKNYDEVQKSAASFGFEDLILVPYVNMDMSDISGMSGSVKLKNEHLKHWGVSENEVFKAAIKNTKNDVEIKDMMEIVAQMEGIPEDIVAQMTAGRPRQLVVSNKSNIYGAAAILGCIEQLKEQYEDGFFVIPSSVHEVIVLPVTEEFDKESLDSMVRDVNATVVSSEDFLADGTYFFG